MKKHTILRSFYHNDQAVSEEFTALPALAVVMIGLTLFILLIANVYQAYETRVDSIKKYQTADFIATKLTNPDCPFIQEAGIVNYNVFQDLGDNAEWKKLQDEYVSSGIGFMIKLSWTDDNGVYHFKEILPIISSFDIDKVGNRVAVSRDVSIQLSEAPRSMGKLTIITWSR